MSLQREPQRNEQKSSAGASLPPTPDKVKPCWILLPRQSLERPPGLLKSAMLRHVYPPLRTTSDRQPPCRCELKPSFLAVAQIQRVRQTLKQTQRQPPAPAQAILQSLVTGPARKTIPGQCTKYKNQRAEPYIRDVPFTETDVLQSAEETPTTKIHTF